MSLGGTYDYAYNLSNAPSQVSCNGVGTVIISQNGTQFSGVHEGAVLCQGPGGELADAGSGPITGGSINDRQVSFNFSIFESGCSATGNATGSPVNNISGNITCTLSVDGQIVQLTGTWQASR